MPRGNSDLVDVTVRLHRETEKAICVSDDGDERNTVWLPLSQIEYVLRDYPNKIGGRGIIEVTMPEWLAIEKGLA